MIFKEMTLIWYKNKSKTILLAPDNPKTKTANSKVDGNGCTMDTYTMDTYYPRAPSIPISPSLYPTPPDPNTFATYWHSHIFFVQQKCSKNCHRQKGAGPRRTPNYPKHPPGRYFAKFGFFLGRLPFGGDHLLTIF